jgi:two-component system sensor histidine kinase QseC
MNTQPVPSLQNRLLLILMSVVTAVWLGAALFTWWDARHELDELLDSHLAQAAALLVAQQTHIDNDDDDDVLDVRPMHKYAPAVAFQVFHLNVLVMGSPNVGNKPMATLERGFTTVTLPDGEAWRVFAAKGDHRDVQVYVGEKIRNRTEIVLSVLRSLLLPLLVTLPLLAGLLWSSVRLALAPLRRLSELLGQRQPRALSPFAAQGVPAEMQPLIAELNGLLARIGHMVETERRFTADAAHELRTPIAAIRAQAQVAMGAGSDDAQRQLALQTTLAGCDRAARLVEQLLALARLETQDTNAQPAHPAVSDLSALTQSVAATLAPLALARSQELELDASADCQVPGDETLLSMLVRNLLDNAMRYAPDGAHIRVVVAPSSHGVSLDVQDSGAGMAQADRQRLGERFFRVLGQNQAGSGLGWSIVRRIAQVTGATVAVQQSKALGGLQVTVGWPRPAKIG